MNIYELKTRLKTHLLPELHFWAELSAICTLATDLFWIVLLYQVLVIPPAGWFICVWIMSLVLFGSNALSRYLLYKKYPHNIRRTILVFVSFLTILFSYQIVFYSAEPFSLLAFFSHPFLAFFTQADSSSEFWHLVFILGLLWRGSGLSTDLPSSDSPALSFVVGIVLFIIYGVFFNWQNPGISFTCFFAFLTFALISMAAGKIAAVGYDRMGKLPAYHPAWLIWILGVSGGLVLLSLITGWLLSAPLSSFINQLLTLLYLIFIGFVLLILYPTTWILGMAYPFLQTIFSNLGGDEQTGQTLQDYLSQFTSGTEENSQSIITAFQTLRPWFMVAVLIIIIIIVILSIWNENIRKKKMLLADESEQAFPYLPFQKKEVENADAKRNRTQKNWKSAARIRRVYMHLLDLASKLGEPRAKHTTPLEYLPRLVFLFPQERESLTQITLWYNSIRYGELPENDVEAQYTESTWKRILESGKIMLSERKQQEKKRD